MLLFLKNLLFTIVVPGTVAVYVPWSLFTLETAPRFLNTLSGGFLLTLGGSIYLWCLWDFATAGRGTPAPIDPPKKLVIRGLYRYTRNPMYVGVLTVIFGWALFFSEARIALYGLSVAVLFHLFIVFYEEPHLRQAFGSSYDEYCRRVGRWMPFRPAA